MEKEAQRKVVERILEKSPLSKEEGEILRLNSREPGEYPVPGEYRECGMCGVRFRDTLDAKGNVEVSMLEKFSDHQATHNPSPAEWTEAYNKLRVTKGSTHTP